MQLTKIEWCDATINFWEGCTKVSPGCKNCYAENRDIRWHEGKHWGKDAPRKWVKAGELRARALDSLSENGLFCLDRATGHRGPIRPEQTTEKIHREGMEFLRFHPVRPLVFCLSLGDFFDPEVGTYFRIQAFKTIAASPGIDWMILTKRPHLIVNQLQAAWQSLQADETWERTGEMLAGWLSGDPPANVALGTSVENQAALDERLDPIREAPARRRFLSAEPLLGPLRFPWTMGGIHQIITGGESGAKARPCHPAWITSIARQAQERGIAHHHKQWGEWVDTEIVPPPAGWTPGAGRAVYIDREGSITGPGHSPVAGARMLWQAGKRAAGSEMLDLETGQRRYSKGLLQFP